MPDARGQEHGAANGRRAGAVPHGESEARLVLRGSGGQKKANPRTSPRTVGGQPHVDRKLPLIRRILLSRVTHRLDEPSARTASPRSRLACCKATQRHHGPNRARLPAIGPSSRFVENHTRPIYAQWKEELTLPNQAQNRYRINAKSCGIRPIPAGPSLLMKER